MKDDEIDRLLGLAEEVVARAMARGVDVAEARARSGFELSVKVRKGEAELVEEAGYEGLGMRVIKDGRVALTSTSDLTQEGVDRFLDAALELVEISQEDAFAGPADPSLVHVGELPDLALFDPACAAIDAAGALEIATRGERAALEHDARISNSEGATFARMSGGSALVLSGGFRAFERTSLASLFVVPIADDEGGKKRRGAYWGAKRFFEDLETPEAIGLEAARRTLEKLGARKVATCEAPVVFDPDSARSLLGLIAGCVMGSAVWRKSSYLAGREDTRVASELVTIVDDPLILRGPGSRAFDGEGLLSRKNTIIEQGILKSYLCDSYSARKLNRASTASAARGRGGEVGPTTTNFVLRPSARSTAEIMGSTERGLYVTGMMGFGFNAVTGDFSRGASGFWIENGELAFPVSEVTISKNLDDLLKDIDAVGDDLDLRSSLASPTIRVKSMVIGGS